VQEVLFGLSKGTLSEPFDVVEVRFKARRTGFFRNGDRLTLRPGDKVVVEADRGQDLGSVYLVDDLVRVRLQDLGLPEDDAFPAVLRVASEDEIRAWDELVCTETDALETAGVCVDEIGLPMRLEDAEWQFDRNRITFYFTAERRVDFRGLVRMLARRFRTRVELRQIGARDQAGRAGGLGVCGRELCCSMWLREFEPVATNAAKDQNLPLNPARISGQCGRLKCCLNYELETYTEAMRRFPALDTRLQTQKGVAVVGKLDIFSERVWLRYQDGTWDDLSLVEADRLLSGDET
jgi:cell fate regulator YaaT (PSP1 superfamily)